MLERLRGERNETALAVEEQPPVVGGEDAGDDLAERRLAGAVLADERVHGARARPSSETRVERQDASEVLGDVLELDVRSSGAAGRSSPATPR